MTGQYRGQYYDSPTFKVATEIQEGSTGLKLAPHLATQHGLQDFINTITKPPSLPHSSQETTCHRKSFLSYQNQYCCTTLAFRGQLLSADGWQGEQKNFGRPGLPCPFPRGHAGSLCPFGCYKSQGKIALKAPSPKTPMKEKCLACERGEGDSAFSIFPLFSKMIQVPETQRTQPEKFEVKVRSPHLKSYPACINHFIDHGAMICH